MTKYEWSLNGTVVGATSTYTVPASATTGDIIAVTVTAEDGETATDSVIVSGLTITGVEPTTATTGGVGYKYVRIFFSEPLSSLDASEVEIRDVKSKQLFSLESVKLSSSGLFADVILYGSNDADGTTFLQPNTPYVATIDHDGMTDSLEFELPANVADDVVVGVNEEENEIYTQTSGRTQAIHHGWGVIGQDPGTGDDIYGNIVATYSLGASYDGNIGELLGRTVNFGYNGDEVITDLTVQDEVVVIDTMKYVDPNKNGYDKKDYFETNDGAKYYFETSNTATKNPTHFLDATDATNENDFVGFAPNDGDVYNYVRLTLNPTGTIATAVLNANVTDFLRVASVDDNVVIADKNTSMNFSGYTMFNNEELISTDDLEVGDVVYYSIPDKFAYVYNESISGELDNVIHEKLDLDGTTYTWTDAKYYDDGSETYKTLPADTDAKSVASQKYLNSLDPDDVTITLNMGGTIAYVDGEVIGASETTTTTYVLTGAPALKEVGFDKQFKLSVNDGTSSSTITFKPSDLKSLDGEAGSTKTVTAGDAWSFTFNPTDKTPATITKTSGTNYLYPELVDVITDASTGAVVGLKEIDKTDGDTGIAITATSDNADKINSDITTVTAGGDKYAVSGSTKVWIVVNDDGDAKAKSVKMVNFSDLDVATTPVGTAANFEAFVYPDKANAKHIVINQKAGKDKETWDVGDKAEVKGVVVDTKEIAKGDGSDTVVIKDITIQDATGTKLTLDADGQVVKGEVKAGDLVTLEYTKNNEKVTKVTSHTWATGTQLYNVAYSTGTISLSDGTTITPYSSCLILKKATVGGTTTWTPITVGEINSSVNGWNVEYNIVSGAATDDVTSDFVVVEDNDTARTTGLTIAVNNKGTISGDKATKGGTLKYVVVTNDPAATIAAWTTKTTVTAANTDLTTLEGGTTALGAKPTLAGGDDGKYLVVAEIDSTKNTILAAGAVEIDLSPVGLTVAVSGAGVISGDTATADGTIMYALVAGDPTVTVTGWTTFTTAATVASDLGTALTATAPTITSAYNTDYLVVTELDSNNQLVAVGISDAIATVYQGSAPVINVTDPTAVTITATGSTGIKYEVLATSAAAPTTKAALTNNYTATFDATAGGTGTYKVYAIATDAYGDSEIVASATITVP